MKHTIKTTVHVLATLVITILIAKGSFTKTYGHVQVLSSEEMLRFFKK